MNFASLQFAGFFLAVLFLYYRFGVRGQNRLMMVAGWIFYAAFDWRFLGLLWLSTVVDFFVGRALSTATEQRRRKALLATSIVVQIGILAVFKYFDFFVTSASDLLGDLGFSVSPALLHVVVPVGISFYTFQTLAYVFAVYRGELEAERDPTTFGAFVAWFPQLAAGPIERANSLLPQIQKERKRPHPAVIESGAMLILRGLFKKMVLADGVATFVDSVFSSPGAYSWNTIVLAAIGFSIQVYGDFSGYSDIARGTSRLLGVELRWNFEQPFLSRDMREFWNRWHTSLGWWFTEHVARPLGPGGGRIRAGLIVMLVFTLIGLWHGPAWTFVVWGIYNGVLVVIWRNLSVPAGQHPMKLRLPDVPRIVRTFALFCLGAILFRAATFSDAGTMFSALVNLKDTGRPNPTGWELVPINLVLMVALDLLDRRRRIVAIETTRTRARLGGVATRAEAALESPIAGLTPLRAGILVGVLLLGVIVFSSKPAAPFIYFQF